MDCLIYSISFLISVCIHSLSSSSRCMILSAALLRTLRLSLPILVDFCNLYGCDPPHHSGSRVSPFHSPVPRL
jgi:hypothetical protein